MQDEINLVSVIDNFLLTEDYLNIKKEFLTQSNFPWYFDNIVDNDNDVDNLKKFQFTHHFIRESNTETGIITNSNYHWLMDPFYARLNPKKFFRIKANLLTKTNLIIENQFHRDVDQHCLTGIYYVNSNNGYTLFQNGEKIASKANRYVYFNSQLLHAGSTCSDEKIRVVINFNYTL